MPLRRLDWMQGNTKLSCEHIAAAEWQDAERDIGSQDAVDCLIRRPVPARNEDGFVTVSQCRPRHRQYFARTFSKIHGKVKSILP